MYELRCRLPVSGSFQLTVYGLVYIGVVNEESVAENLVMSDKVT